MLRVPERPPEFADRRSSGLRQHQQPRNRREEPRDWLLPGDVVEHREAEEFFQLAPVAPVFAQLAKKVKIPLAHVAAEDVSPCGRVEMDAISQRRGELNARGHKPGRSIHA